MRKLLVNCYQDVKASVVTNGEPGPLFDVHQSVRQGSVLGSWLYLVYINELLQTLENSRYGIAIQDIECASPTQADDIALVSLSPQNLQEMLTICGSYSRKWRFHFNTSKTKVMVFGESVNTGAKLSNIRQWGLLQSNLQEVDSHTHVGVQLNNKLRCNTQVDHACNKARRTLFSLIGYGVRPEGLSVLSASKLYMTVVVPGALYGCELWNVLSGSDLAKLERTHRQAAKLIQQLPQRTSTTASLAMLGWLPMEVLIDRRKLLFLGRLCRQDFSTTANRVLLCRLFQHQMQNTSKQLGFAQDIFRILRKYGLEDSLRSYLTGSEWPCKPLWKKTVARATQVYYTDSILSAESSKNVELFLDAHRDITKPHPAWLAMQTCHTGRPQLFFLARLCTVRGLGQSCEHCVTDTADLVQHLVTVCPHFVDIREYYWMVMVNEFPVEVSRLLFNLSDEDFMNTALGDVAKLDDNLAMAFLKLTARVWYALRNTTLIHYQ